MRNMGFEWRRAGVVAAALTLLTVSTVWAQERAPAGSSRAAAVSQSGWRVVTSPALDLWFHGLAITGFTGFGAFPLYDPAYVIRSRAAQRAAGVESSRLDAGASTFRSAFERDSAFEVLHFVPLVVPIRDPSSLLRVMRAVAGGEPAAASADAGIQRIAGALMTALPLASERGVLAGFTDALEDEWRLWLRGWMERTAVEREGNAARTEALWREQVEPRLAGWLRAGGLDRGTIVLTPVLGAEGRFVEGDPGNPDDNLVAVRDAEPAEVVVAVLRELCYPTVRAAMAKSGVQFADRVEATRISDRAATVCGAVLAGRVSDALAARFRARFAAATPDRGGVTLPPAIEAALKQELERRKG